MNAPLFAGMGGHQGARSRTDTWMTPRPIIEALGGADSFDLDPCMIEDRPWPTARLHYTRRDNGLLLPWGGRVWCNAPYSQPLFRHFMARMAAHGQGTALIFARTETRTFVDHVWGAATAVLFVAGRITFCTPDGQPARKKTGAEANGGAPSVLCAYGEADAEILAFCGIRGQFVPLHFTRRFALGALDQTWMQAVTEWFAAQDGPVALSEVYRAFARRPKARRNPNYQAKIRQVLQQGAGRRVARGLWARAA